jgi:hypothetical protein
MQRIILVPECPHCEGIGLEYPDARMICRTCEGYGFVTSILVRTKRCPALRRVRRRQGVRTWRRTS